MTHRWCALGLAFILPFASCGGDEATTDDVEDVAEEPGGSPDDSTTTSTLEPAEVPDPADAEEPPTTSTGAEIAEPTPDRWAGTPLAQYWGYAEIDSQEYWDQDLAVYLEQEELTATCMAEQGFEYVPFPPPYHPAIVGESGTGVPELSADEEREQYGYGISTRLGVVGPAITREVVVNPNALIADALGAAGSEAYYRALSGDSRFITESTPLTERGCSGQAEQEVRGVELALWDQLGDEQQQLRQRIDNDPRMVRATLEWSRCMGAAGYVYAAPNDITDELHSRTEPFQMLGDPYEVLTQAEIDALTPEELEAVVAELSALSPEQQAELDAIQAFELAVAAADHECGIPLDDVRYEVTVELEQAFVDEHLALLEAIVAARGS